MKRLVILFFAISWSQFATANVVVFSTDFEGLLPSEISPGTATVVGVQGYSGLGMVGNQFGGSFLRSATANTVTLTLANLPAHNFISLGFLFAAIDSLDGTGTFPQGDFFSISLDGTEIFSESFANATDAQIQSYEPPVNVTLARKADLGFTVGSFFRDGAYDMGADPQFQNIMHSASTAEFEFVMEGEGVQSLTDESWAIDNLVVSVSPVPVPTMLPLFIIALGSSVND